MTETALSGTSGGGGSVGGGSDRHVSYYHPNAATNAAVTTHAAVRDEVEEGTIGSSQPPTRTASSRKALLNAFDAAGGDATLGGLMQQPYHDNEGAATAMVEADCGGGVDRIAERSTTSHSLSDSVDGQHIPGPTETMDGSHSLSTSLSIDSQASDQSGEMARRHASYGSLWGAIVQRLRQYATVIQMLLVLLVPVGFLIGYTAANVDPGLAAIRVMDGSVAPLASAAIRCAHELQTERGRSGTYIAAPPARKPTVAPVVAAQRAVVDAICNVALFDAAISSSLEQRDTIVERMKRHLSVVSALRAKVAGNLISGLDSFDAYTAQITNVIDVLALAASDSRLQPLRVQLQNLLLLRHVNNNFALCRGVGSYLLNLNQSLSSIELAAVTSCRIATQSYLTMLQTIGDAAARRYFAIWSNNTNVALSLEMEAQFVAGNYRGLSGTVWFDTYTNALNQMLTEDEKLLDDVRRGDTIRNDAFVEGMKLLAALVASFMAAAATVYNQNLSRKKIEAALKMSSQLTMAVRRFVPRNQLRVMGVRSILEVSPGDHTEVAQSLLFSDIRGFTAISAKMTNEDLFQWLQTFFHKMTGITERHNGFVDKFIGDAIFSVFSSPRQAVTCGIEMQWCTEQINAKMNALTTGDMLQIGVGIHHGVVVAGVLGDKTRLTCTLIASCVNLASRLEGLTKAFGAKIIISRDVMERIDMAAHLHRYLGFIQVQGATAPLDIFEIFQNDAPTLKAFKRDTKDEFEAAVKMQFTDRYAALATFAALKRRPFLCKSPMPRCPPRWSTSRPADRDL